MFNLMVFQMKANISRPKYIAIDVCLFRCIRGVTCTLMITSHIRLSEHFLNTFSGIEQLPWY